ncbi:dienelactone hydrolase family protein [Novosphingobium colocasiae]|uniref:Hydrolase n=1 Tax=Novosphingobium colocasiae TaxID=1256513 RepID=A0A918PEE2_9SPHN|nr:dienelactone hydrolase family protein [Novosphingobium colocasiae]GGZ03097.1 hydrolase [Novosphingobium colocasiae]
MCDDLTPQHIDTLLARRGLTRRSFAALGTAGMLAGCGSMRAAAGDAALAERSVSISTADGVCDGFLVHPAEGAHPGVLMWPDIAGLREVKRIMARALAAQGYAVLVINPYYRSAPAPVFNSISEVFAAGGMDKVKPMRALLTPAAITRDAAAFTAFLDGNAAVDRKRKLGTYGFCMGGPFTVRTAAAAPERVGAAASFHGGGLVGAEPDSPVRLLERTKASYLFAIARDDDAKQPADKDALRTAADAAHRPAEIEVYPADHGWCVADAPAWDPVAADKAFERMLALFANL